MNTMQQEFDTVVYHLYKQGRKAKSLKGCEYRTVIDGETLMCAVGCRIPESVYTPAMDESTDNTGTGLQNLIHRFADVLPVEITEYRGMFNQLQSAHDNCRTHNDGTFDLTSLDVRLADTAAVFGLEYSAERFSVVIPASPFNVLPPQD